jgi:hypothetical protein
MQPLFEIFQCRRVRQACGFLDKSQRTFLVLHSQSRVFAGVGGGRALARKADRFSHTMASLNNRMYEHLAILEHNGITQYLPYMGPLYLDDLPRLMWISPAEAIYYLIQKDRTCSVMQLHSQPDDVSPFRWYFGGEVCPIQGDSQTRRNKEHFIERRRPSACCVTLSLLTGREGIG